MELIFNLAKFAIILGALILVHELGHFLTAKKRGVLVKKFSIGFGPRLFSLTLGETEYCISCVPLGGYVKMAGQEDFPDQVSEDEQDIPEERKFYSKKVWERMAIVAAGPAMNFALGVCLFAIVLMFGIQIPLYLKDTRIGKVLPGSPAAQAGLQPGDRVLTIDGKPISDWQQLSKTTLLNPDKELICTIQREDAKLEFSITPSYYERSLTPGIGISPWGTTKVYEIIPDSPAQRAGLEPGDLILSINGKEVGFPDVVDIIRENRDAPLRLGIKRKQGDEDVMLEKTVYPEVIGTIAGIVSKDGIVVGLEGKQSEFNIGDVIRAVNGTPLSGTDIDRFIIEHPGTHVTLTIEQSTLQFFWKKTTDISVEADITETGRIGAGLTYDDASITEVYPWYLVPQKSVYMAFETIGYTFKSLGFIVTRRFKLRSITGPIGIYKITSSIVGLIQILSLVALISVNLAVINLLPIPVLDGGYILFFLLEALRRKPLDTKYLELLQKVGLALLLALILLVTYNDIIYQILKHR